jgi:hypothetical protein
MVAQVSHTQEEAVAVLAQLVPMGPVLVEMVGLVYRLIYPGRLYSMQAAVGAAWAAVPSVVVLVGLAVGAMQEITQLVLVEQSIPAVAVAVLDHQLQQD